MWSNVHDAIANATPRFDTSVDHTSVPSLTSTERVGCTGPSVRSCRQRRRIDLIGPRTILVKNSAPPPHPTPRRPQNLTVRPPPPQSPGFLRALRGPLRQKGSHGTCPTNATPREGTPRSILSPFRLTEGDRKHVRRNNRRAAACGAAVAAQTQSATSQSRTARAFAVSQRPCPERRAGRIPPAPGARSSPADGSDDKAISRLGSVQIASGGFTASHSRDVAENAWYTSAFREDKTRRLRSLRLTFSPPPQPLTLDLQCRDRPQGPHLQGRVHVRGGQDRG